MHLKRLAWVALLLAPATAVAGEGKVSGEAYADLYWVAENHDSALVDQNGAWFRRIYLTYDYKFDEEFSTRIRLEAASPGDFKSSDVMTTFIKDAYLKWQKSNQSILVGVQPTPTFGIIEDVWYYRSLERTAADLQRLASSRDLGLGFKGGVGPEQKIGYHVLFGNGSSTKAETDTKKKIMAALSYNFTKQLLVEVYGDYEDRVNDADRRTYQGYVAYRGDRFRAGALYMVQNRNTVGEDVELRILSVGAAGAVSDRVWLVGRVDRNFDPNPEGAKITFIPFDPTAANTFVIAAVDFRVRETVSVMPNVEIVVYDEPEAGGPTPDTDVIPRLTFFFRF